MNIKEHFSEKEALVIDIILKQAKLFLLENGAFYPFGTILTCQGEIKPVSGYFEIEHPDPSDIIVFLHNVFEDKMNNSICKFAIICIDIFVNQTINGESIKRDAIELRILSENKEWNKYYIPYFRTKNNDIIFSELSLFE
jgi:hypothetical protein